jgi:hypothetical protein
MTLWLVWYDSSDKRRGPGEAAHRFDPGPAPRRETLLPGVIVK